LRTRCAAAKLDCAAKSCDSEYWLLPLEVDAIAEGIQLLVGASIAMAHDVAGTTLIPRPPRGREEVPVQLSRILETGGRCARNCRRSGVKRVDPWTSSAGEPARLNRKGC
jgi:hypothetical protein